MSKPRKSELGPKKSKKKDNGESPKKTEEDATASGSSTTLNASKESEDYDIIQMEEGYKGVARQIPEEIDMGPSHRNSRKSSMLNTNDDPFAFREGKTLRWQNVNMTLKKSKKQPRKILENVWGEVPERETTAIMGPSGAGKTSLLNILAGRSVTRGPLTVESDVRLNNFAVKPASIKVRKNIAFVAQDDSLQATSTPREAIYFSAKLRLPRSTPQATLIKLVNKMLKELGLEQCADTYVGGALVKGISGGERKRTSVGVELVVRPAMVFLDEPTSGLDSFSAVQLCQVLKKVANAGASVLFTIHQPSSEIFNSFDRLILMNKGRVMYQGPVSSIPKYFKKRNHKVPKNYNPADWIMHVAQSVSLEQLEQDGFFAPDKRKPSKALTGGDVEEGKDEIGLTIREDESMEYYDDRPVTFFTQIKLLFIREMKNLKRDKATFRARVVLTTVMGLLCGTIFFKVGQEPRDVQSNLNSQFGALIMIILMSMFGTAQKALMAFPEERPVFLREYSTNHYSVLPYFMARLTVEAAITAVHIILQCMIAYLLIDFQSNFGMFFLNIYALAMASTALAVFLGCSVEDPKLAQEMLPLLFIPQMLFSGFFVSPELIPSWLRWARYFCSMTYALRIAVVEEFGGGCGSEKGDLACDNLLETLGADPDDVWWNWLVLLSLFILFRLSAVIVLRRKASKFF